MKYKPLKKTIGIKLLTVIILIVYVINRMYTCAITAAQLEIIPFMACCIVIVMAGFALAAACEYFYNKKRAHPISGAPLKQLVEGVFVTVVIIIICIIIYVI